MNLVRKFRQVLKNTGLFIARKKRLLLIILAGIVLFGAGLYGVNKLFEEPEPEPFLTVSVGHPSEQAVDLSSKDFEPNQPRRIVLGTIQTEGFVQQVGLDQNGQVTWPDNIHLAGWFANKPRPGEKGVALIGGHTKGVSNDGIFKNLGNLKSGDTFEVEFGDKSLKKFEVVSVKSYSQEDLADQLFKPNKGFESQLNLVTYDIAAESNEERTLVVSKLIN